MDVLAGTSLQLPGSLQMADGDRIKIIGPDATTQNHYSAILLV